MLKQNATIALDPQIPIFTGGTKKVQTGTCAGLVLTGELLPDNEMQHHILATLLDEENPPEVDVEFKNVAGKLTYKLTFTSKSDVLAKAKESHDLHVDARNANLTVPQLVEKRAAAAKIEEERKEAEEKAAKAAESKK